MKKNITGIRYIIQRIIFICASCSGEPPILGCIFCIKYVFSICVTQKRRQKMLMWLPMGHIDVPQLMSASYDERSSAHRKLCWRSSMALGTKLNRAMNMGIWMSIGRQPPIGLAPYCEYTVIISCCFFIASSGLGYFALISSM